MQLQQPLIPVHCRGTITVMRHLAAQQITPSTALNPGRGWVLFLTPCHATPWYSHLHARLPMRFLDCSPPGWAPAVACLNPARGSPPGWAPAGGNPGHGSSGSGSSSGSNHDGGGGGGGDGSGESDGDSIASVLPSAPAALRDCHRLFNASAVADPAFRSERQQFEAAPAAFLQHHLPEVPGGQTRGSSDPSGRLPKQVVLFDDMLGRIKAWAQPRGFVQTQRFAHAQFGVDGDREGAVLVLELQNNLKLTMI